MRLRPPAIPGVIFIVFSLVACIGLQQPMINSDGDAARHLRHGLYMLEHHQLIRADPFSFTRPGAPFLAFEYGSQLLLALAHQAGGIAGVVVLAGLVIALAYTLLAAGLLRLGVDPLLAYITTLGAATLGAGHWVARPHLLSFLAILLLLWCLERPRPAPLWVFVPLFAVWANVHGGFVFGWMLLGAYLTGAATEWATKRSDPFWKGRTGYLAAALGLAIAATVLNPRGLELHRHLVAFFGQKYLLDNTAEFVSPDFHDIGGKVYLVGLLCTVGVLTLLPARPSFPRLFAMALTFAIGLVSIRNVPLFGLVAVPLLALHANAAWRALPDPRDIRTRFAATAASGSTLGWAVPVGLALALLGLNHGRVGGVQLVADRLDPTVFPVAAVAQAREAGLRGRLFSEFTWGGYVDYAWPEQKIFIDGGTDFFGVELFREYGRIKRLSPGWRTLLERWKIDLTLLRPSSSLAHELSRDGRWIPWHCDSVAVLFRLAPDSPPFVGQAAADSSERALVTCSGGQQQADSSSARDTDQ